MPTIRVGTPSIGIDPADDGLVAAERTTATISFERSGDVFRAGQRVFFGEDPSAHAARLPSAGISSEVTIAELTRRG